MLRVRLCGLFLSDGRMKIVSSMVRMMLSAIVMLMRVVMGLWVCAFCALVVGLGVGERLSAVVMGFFVGCVYGGFIFVYVDDSFLVRLGELI